MIGHRSLRPVRKELAIAVDRTTRSSGRSPVAACKGSYRMSSGENGKAQRRQFQAATTARAYSRHSRLHEHSCSLEGLLRTMSQQPIEARFHFRPNPVTENKQDAATDKTAALTESYPKRPSALTLRLRPSVQAGEFRCGYCSMSQRLRPRFVVGRDSRRQTPRRTAKPAASTSAILLESLTHYRNVWRISCNLKRQTKSSSLSRLSAAGGRIRLTTRRRLEGVGHRIAHQRAKEHSATLTADIRDSFASTANWRKQTT